MRFMYEFYVSCVYEFSKKSRQKLLQNTNFHFSNS